MLQILPAEAQAVLATARHAECSGTGSLGQEQAALIQRADTFFIATHHEAEADNPVSIRSGNDISHRGGAPGFVQLDAPDTLRWADYTGNNFFQTLGETISHTVPTICFSGQEILRNSDTTLQKWKNSLT